MILLGIDYGTVRVGLATLDTDIGIGFPLVSVEGGNVAEVVAQILKIVAAEYVEKIVVGMPYSLREGNQQGKIEEVVLKFVDALKNATPITVVTEDERMTSALVERERRDMGMKKSSFDKDAAAAAAILESYWERTK